MDKVFLIISLWAISVGVMFSIPLLADESQPGELHNQVNLSQVAGISTQQLSPTPTVSPQPPSQTAAQPSSHIPSQTAAQPSSHIPTQSSAQPSSHISTQPSTQPSSHISSQPSSSQSPLLPASSSLVGSEEIREPLSTPLALFSPLPQPTSIKIVSEEQGIPVDQNRQWNIPYQQNFLIEVVCTLYTQETQPGFDDPGFLIRLNDQQLVQFSADEINQLSAVGESKQVIIIDPLLYLYQIDQLEEGVNNLTLSIWNGNTGDSQNDTWSVIHSMTLVSRDDYQFLPLAVSPTLVTMESGYLTVEWSRSQQEMMGFSYFFTPDSKLPIWYPQRWFVSSISGQSLIHLPKSFSLEESASSELRSAQYLLIN